MDDRIVCIHPHDDATRRRVVAVTGLDVPGTILLEEGESVEGVFLIRASQIEKLPQGKRQLTFGLYFETGIATAEYRPASYEDIHALWS